MRTIVFLALLTLTACHNDRPPAPDAADNAQLDEAGNMLDDLAEDAGNEPQAEQPLAR